MSEDFPGLTVTPGAVRLHYALKVVDDPHAKVWQIDLHSKYAQVLAVEHSPGGKPLVLLTADDRTLGLDESALGRVTEVAVDDLDGAWIVDARCSRYTLTIFAYEPRCGDPEER